MVNLFTKGMEGMVISGWAFTIAICNMVMAITIHRIMPRQTTAMATNIGPILNEMDTIGTEGIV